MSIQSQIERISSEVEVQTQLIRQIASVLAGKAGGSGLPSGISKLEVLYFTPTDANLDLTIPHNLGEAPNFFVWFTDEGTGTPNVARAGMMAKMPATDTVGNLHDYLSLAYHTSDDGFSQDVRYYPGNAHNHITSTSVSLYNEYKKNWLVGSTYCMVVGVLDFLN